MYSFPGATDNTLFQKFERQHKSNQFYRSPTMKLREPVFTVVHYASDVTYSVQVCQCCDIDMYRSMCACLDKQHYSAYIHIGTTECKYVAMHFT